VTGRLLEPSRRAGLPGTGDNNIDLGRESPPLGLGFASLDRGALYFLLADSKGVAGIPLVVEDDEADEDEDEILFVAAGVDVLLDDADPGFTFESKLEIDDRE
jgi:hypothetical protein